MLYVDVVFSPFEIIGELLWPWGLAAIMMAVVVTALLVRFFKKKK